MPEFWKKDYSLLPLGGLALIHVGTYTEANLSRTTFSCFIALVKDNIDILSFTDSDLVVIGQTPI
jgi:hypothetical protein